MWKKLTAFFNNQPADDVEESLLALQQQIQSLKLELTERQQIISRLNHSLEKQREGEQNTATEKAKVQIENLMLDASAPAAQLLTLAHLFEVEGKTLLTRDVIVVARRLVHVLEKHGLEPGDEIGEVVGFDANRHEPLAQGIGFGPGDPVQIRFPGIAYQGRLLRKAGVSALQKTAGSEGA